jgi:hypothetical protein
MKAPFLLFGLVTVLAANAAAQSADPLTRLHSAKTLHCTFPTGVVAAWNDSLPRPDRKGFTAPFIYDQIEPDSSRARFIGNNGAENVWAQANSIGLHFLEQVPAGGLNLTTVFGEMLDRVTATYRAVHSRHVVPFEPLPSQYYGRCRITG